MDLGLRRRVVLIAGAGKGIGEAAAERLALEGADLAICARGKGALGALALRLTESGSNCLPIIADVSTEEGVHTCVDRTIAHFGRLDVVVHNAGGATGRGLLSELSDDEWLATFNTNVIAAIRHAMDSRARTGLVYLENTIPIPLFSIKSQQIYRSGDHAGDH